MENMENETQLKRLASDLGADFFGIADLAPAQDAILAQGGERIWIFPRAISIGIALLDSIVNQLPRRDELAVAVSYEHHAYDVINRHLDLITSRLGSELQKAGFAALPVPASKTIDEENLAGEFSHKMAAHLSGLGWIGKNCLLITPERGPRVRWGTILTDAPLVQTGTTQKEQCGDCEECVLICPVKAFSGRPFLESEPREFRFDAHKCARYLTKMEEQGKIAVCGMCLYICPAASSRG